MRPPTLADNWEQSLPLSHREALHEAAIIYIDEFFVDYQSDEPVGGTRWAEDLPARYKTRYDWYFGQRFLACLMVLTWKLAQKHPPAPLLDCVAEELAMHTLIETAKVGLRLDGVVEVDFEAFESEVLQNSYCDLLYQDAKDGVVGGKVGYQIGETDLLLDTWFEPFTTAGSTLHPYLRNAPEIAAQG